MQNIEFKIRTAEHTILIHARYSTTKQYCRKYIVGEDQAADVEISASDEDLRFEKEMLIQSDKGAGTAPRPFTDVDFEITALHRKLARELLKDDVLLFHGSCIALDGVGYMFIAKSGTGKSTHSRLWREQFGARTFMVNDDKPFVKVFPSGEVRAYGSPWDGKERLDTNTSVPLKAIAALHRDTVNHIEPVEKAEQIGKVMESVYYPPLPAERLKTIELVDRLLLTVRFYSLGCDMTPEAAIVSCSGMNA